MMNCNNNCGCGYGNRGVFDGYELFWIVVIIAIVILWIQCGCNNYGVCGNNCGNNCCGNDCGNMCC